MEHSTKFSTKFALLTLLLSLLLTGCLSAATNRSYQMDSYRPEGRWRWEPSNSWQSKFDRMPVPPSRLGTRWYR